MSLTIGITDDHKLFLESMGLLINTFKDMQVVLQATDGRDLLNQLETTLHLPTIILVDVNMPVMNGLITIGHLAKQFPHIKTAALSMQEDEEALIRMLTAGCHGWWLKDIAADELESALRQIDNDGYYNADLVNRNWRGTEGYQPDSPSADKLDRDILHLRSQSNSWEEIAIRISLPLPVLNERRQALYKKFHVGSDIGLILEALRHRLIGPTS